MKGRTSDWRLLPSLGRLGASKAAGPADQGRPHAAGPLLSRMGSCLAA